MFRKLPNLKMKKILGTIHIALGDTTSFAGGHTESKIHPDGILSQLTVKVDRSILV